MYFLLITMSPTPRSMPSTYKVLNKYSLLYLVHTLEKNALRALDIQMLSVFLSM